jgi:quercetin dioxygenase-like cupin family protein
MSTMKYTRVYADAKGESHIEDVEVELNATDFAPPAPPLNLSPLTPAKRVGFLHAPPGWSGDWHPAPKRQMIFYLAGETEGATSDGEVRRFGPGDVVLLEDTTGKGHRSRVVGNQEVIGAVVQLED